MKAFTVISIVAALACGAGCGKKDAGEKPAQQVNTDVLIRCHFVGTASLANNTNAARNTMATFDMAGAYKLKATATDPESLSTSGTVNVTVDQTLSSIAVAPGAETVLPTPAIFPSFIQTCPGASVSPVTVWTVAPVWTGAPVWTVAPARTVALVAPA